MTKVSRLLAVLPPLLLLACQEETGAGRPARRELPSRSVQLVEAREQSLERWLILDGSLRADEVATLGAVVAGRLLEVPVDLGSRVEFGVVLARLDPAPFRLRLQQARAAVSEARSLLGLPLAGDDDTVDVEAAAIVRQARAVLAEAQANLTRMRSSFEQGLIGASDLEPAVAQAEVAAGRYQDALETIRTRIATLARRRSELAVAERELAETAITAPFAGAVLGRLAAPGQYLQTGAPVVELVKTDPLRLVLEVPELEAAAIAVGQEVRFQTADGGPEHEGTVVRLAPGLREASRTLRLEAEVPNADALLRPGSFVRARLELAPAPAVLVPVGAVRRFAGVEKVAVAREGRAHLVVVRTGRRVGEEFEILEGLAAGATVVREIGDLVDGQPLVPAVP